MISTNCEALAIPETGVMSVDFQKTEQRLREKRSTLGLAVGVFMMPIGFAMDLAFYPDALVSLSLIRFLTTVALGVGLAVFLRCNLGKLVGPLSVGLVLIPSLAMSLMIYLTDGGQSHYFYGLILLMIIVHMLGFNLTESLVYCITVVVAYAAAVVGHGDFSTDDLKLLIRGLFFLVTSGVLCVLICYLNRENRWNAFQLQRQVQQLGQARLDFLADVSHELRTPLTLIAAPLDEVLSVPGRLEESVGQRLAIMRRNVARLRLLVDEVLDVARKGNASLPLHREEIDVREFLTQLVTLTEGAANAARVSLVLEGETNPMTVSGDRARLERVVSNLISNAMKFSPADSKIVIRLTAETDHALIEVLDQGPGIPRDDQDRIFERSFQADNVDQDLTSRGHGLGLAIAKRIVQAHGGEIDVLNREEGGSNFRVRFPLNHSVSVPTPSQVIAQQQENLQAPILKPSLKPMLESVSPSRLPEAPPQRPDAGKVLVIDDEHELREYLADCLRQDHFLETARTASDGITRALAKPPECILLDLMLPDVRGFSALHRLRSEASLADTKILMLTANGDENTKLAALQQGADDFLSKPFGIAELRARVKVLVESSQTQQELRREKSRLTALLLDLKQSELKLLQSEKMRSIADLSAGLLHEINNPVNFSLMALSVLDRRSDLDAPTVDTLGDIREGVTRISDIVSDLRAFAHPEHQKVVSVVDLPDAVRTAKRFAAGELDGIDLVIEDDGPLASPVMGSKSQIVQVFLNVIINAKNAIERTAIDASDTAGRGRIVVNAAINQDRLVVTIADNGDGMSSEQLTRIREPFVTIDHQRGLGLGIPICQSIVENHSGVLRIESELGHGTQVSFDFQLAVTDNSPSPSPPSFSTNVVVPNTHCE